MSGLDVSGQSLAMEYVVRYFEKKSFLELGYKDDESNLDCYTAEAFLIIATEISKYKKSKTKSAKRSRR